MVVGELPKQHPLDAIALHCILREPWGLRAIVLIVRPTVTICYYLMLANGKKNPGNSISEVYTVDSSNCRPILFQEERTVIFPYIKWTKIVFVSPCRILEVNQNVMYFFVC